MIRLNMELHVKAGLAWKSYDKWRLQFGWSEVEYCMHVQVGGWAELGS